MLGSARGPVRLAAGASRRKARFGEHSEPRCGNVPLTRTPGTPPEDGYAPRYLAFIAESGEVPGDAINHQQSTIN